MSPTLSQIGVYQIFVTHISGNASPDIIVGMSATDGDLSATSTTAFQADKGINVWASVGYITNTTTTPTVTFTYQSGTLAGLGGRMYADAVMFESVDTCSGVAATLGTVGGPLQAGQTFVNVLGVDGAATNVSVYADGVLIGQRSTGIVAGSNSVPTSALVASQQITATQSKNGCTSTRPSSGPPVGTGPNATIRVALSLASNATNTGPIGASSAIGLNYYFLRGTGPSSGFGSAPLGADVLAPNSCWYTLSYTNDLENGYFWNGVGTFPNTDAWASFEGIALCMDEFTGESGPYDIYIDNIMNGDTVIEGFEGYTNGTPEVMFRNPRVALAPPPRLLTAPDSTAVSGNNAFSGTNSIRVRWQFDNNTPNTPWVHLYAAGSGHTFPQVDLRQPISFSILILPAGETTNKLYFPTPPANQTKTTNETATFSVVAAGEGPFAYQWKYEGNDLTGETLSSFSKSNVQLSDAGTYSVTVTGAGGAGCSATVGAELTVTEFVAPPTITYTWNGTALQLNWTGTFNLESKTNLSQANWTSVGVSSGPYNVPLTGTATFYRLHNP